MISWILPPPLTCSTGDSSLSCTYDFSTAGDDFDQVCTAAGGQAVDYSFAITCEVTAADGESADVQYLFVNSPNCIGQSCSDDEDQLNEYASDIASTLDSLDSISNCEVTEESAAPATMLGAIIGGVLLASTVLF